MPTKHLEATVRQEPSIAVIDLTGEINGFAQEALDAAYAEAESNDPGAILLNFEGVDYILSEHYVEIFDVTRLSDFISVLPDEKSAIAKASVS